MKIINKIAFLVHEPVMYAHYSSVWAAMDRNSFVIVLLGVFVGEASESTTGVTEFMRTIRELGYEFAYLEHMRANGVKYKYVVSNHAMGAVKIIPPPPKRLYQGIELKFKHAVNKVCSVLGISDKFQMSHYDTEQHHLLQAGVKQVRFMYGADISDGWSLDEWNDIYDLFLCHGPNDEREFKKRFKGNTAIMGYPRYDGYFSPDTNTDEIAAEFNIDAAKKTILWMPTFDAFGDNACSIPFFAEALSKFMNDFNIIVRPHPISFRLDPTGIKLLESLGYNIDRDALRDMNKSYLLADTILCDHGGSAFGALYLGKKLIFLKTPSADTSAVINKSSNLELTKCFPVLSVDNIDQLNVLLNDENYWQERLEYARSLADKYFADYRGNSSMKAAEILGRLDYLIK